MYYSLAFSNFSIYERKKWTYSIFPSQWLKVKGYVHKGYFRNFSTQWHFAPENLNSCFIVFSEFLVWCRLKLKLKIYWNCYWSNDLQYYFNFIFSIWKKCFFNNFIWFFLASYSILHCFWLIITRENISFQYFHFDIRLIDFRFHTFLVSSTVSLWLNACFWLVSFKTLHIAVPKKREKHEKILNFY